MDTTNLSSLLGSAGALVIPLVILAVIISFFTGGGFNPFSWLN